VLVTHAADTVFIYTVNTSAIVAATVAATDRCNRCGNGKCVNLRRVPFHASCVIKNKTITSAQTLDTCHDEYK